MSKWEHSHRQRHSHSIRICSISATSVMLSLRSSNELEQLLGALRTETHHLLLLRRERRQHGDSMRVICDRKHMYTEICSVSFLLFKKFILKKFIFFKCIIYASIYTSQSDICFFEDYCRIIIYSLIDRQRNRRFRTVWRCYIIALFIFLCFEFEYLLLIYADIIKKHTLPFGRHYGLLYFIILIKKHVTSEFVFKN